MITFDPARLPVHPPPEVPAPPDPHVRQLEVLNEIARIATLDLELRPLLQRVTDALASKFDWSFVALVSVDADRRAFTCEAVTSAEKTDVHVGYGRAIGSGVVGEVALSERPVVIDDVRRHPNYVETLPGALSEICVPIKHGSELVAVLNVESHRLGAFHDSLPLLLTVADQIAGAIANAHLYEELKERARLMEMMSEVSRTALEATDVDALLDRIVRYLHERFPVGVVSIGMHEPARGVYAAAAIAGGGTAQRGAEWPLSDGITGRCIRSGETQLVLDVRGDPDYVMLDEDVVAELTIPIRFHGEILGVLNLESASPDVFTPANVLAFEAFADQMAGAIRLAGLTRDLEEANRRLERLSMMDGLTGIANRRRFDETLELEWRRATRSATPLALLMVDIDAFKPYNDAHGHQAGDDCLCKVAAVLQENVHRAADLVARYGGEEFAVLLPATDVTHAARMAEVLRERVAESTPVTISIGICSDVPLRAGDFPSLVRCADRALYEAKRAGRNRVVVH
jgi:diguanylate cyclase (GGDEF)-like protein